MMYNRDVKKRKGFSLIELLVAVTIMLLLVGIAAFYLEDYIYKSKVAKAYQDLDMFRSALNLRDSVESSAFSNYNYANNDSDVYYYAWHTDKVASNDANWGTFGGATEAWSNYAANSLSGLIGTYLKNVPKDPWGMPYVLNTSAGYIASLGTDMKTGIGGNTAGITEAGREKDLVSYYLGDKLILTDVVVYDKNNDGSIQTNEYIDFTFNKDVQNVSAANLITDILLSDKETTAASSGTQLGSITAPVVSFTAVAKMKDNGRTLRCLFGENHPATDIIGKWVAVNTALDTGLGYSINGHLFDMDQYFKSPTGSQAFGRPVSSKFNPARQVRFAPAY